VHTTVFAAVFAVFAVFSPKRPYRRVDPNPASPAPCPLPAAARHLPGDRAGTSKTNRFVHVLTASSTYP